MTGKLEKLREIIFQNPALLKELYKIGDQDEFISRLVEIGRELDPVVESDEILEAMRENRRVWIERWI